MYRSSLFFLFLSLGFLYAQQAELRIEQCQEKAQDNYPLIKQYDLIRISEDYTLSNIARAYLPQANLILQASYQNDVTHLPFNINGLEPIDKDQYKAAVELTQLIWDGGKTRAVNQITKSGAEVEKRSVDVQLYSIRERVNDLYFGALLIDKQREQLSLYKQNLEETRQMMLSMIKNEVLTSSELDLLDIELYTLEQTDTRLLNSRKACIQMLSLMMGEQLAYDVRLQLPLAMNTNSTNFDFRPEIALFQSQRRLYQSQEKSISSDHIPKLVLFAQMGYAKPGLNMLSNDFAWYGIGGIRLSWNLSSFYTGKNEKSLLRTKSKMVDVQENTFRYQLNIQLAQIQNEIEQHQDLIEQDEQIVLLRTRIKQSSESKYKNGLYTSNELLRDINAENDAKLQKLTHQIQQALYLYNKKFIIGGEER